MTPDTPKPVPLEETLRVLAHALEKLATCVQEDRYGNPYLSIRIEKD